MANGSAAPAELATQLPAESSGAIADATRAALILDPTNALPLKQDRNLGLELIRGLAILFVMIAHWGNNFSVWFGLGPEPDILQLLGIIAFEYFFVMSGFLIGSLLLDITRIAPTWQNLGVFIVRRWMRTLPLYYLWLGILLVFVCPSDHVAEYALRFGTLTQNFLRPMPNDFFFAVSWSLGIEEWFYVLFSSCLVISAMVLPRRIALVGTLGLFFIGPLILRLQVPGYSDWSTGLGKVVIFRLDEITYGVLMAFLYQRRSWLFRYPIVPFAAGIGMIVYHRQILPAQYFFPLIFSMMALACALTLPMALRLTRAPWLLTAVIRRMSAQSYGLYIVHLTLLVDVAQTLYFRKLVSAWAAVAIAIISPLVVSYVSFHFFESPILAWRPKQRLGGSGRSRTDRSSLSAIGGASKHGGTVATASAEVAR